MAIDLVIVARTEKGTGRLVETLEKRASPLAEEPCVPAACPLAGAEGVQEGVNGERTDRAPQKKVAGDCDRHRSLHSANLEQPEAIYLSMYPLTFVLMFSINAASMNLYSSGMSRMTICLWSVSTGNFATILC